MRSTTGTWVAKSGGRTIGPFDGRGPARAFQAEAQRQGFRVTLERLWEPATARKAMESFVDRTRPVDAQALVGKTITVRVPIGPPDWSTE